MIRRRMQKYVLILIILIFLSAGWWYFGKNNYAGGIKNAEVFQKYTDILEKYEMDIPGGWEVQESTTGGAFTSRIVWQAKPGGMDLGNISQLSVTVVASPSTTQPLSTQKEFDQWLDVEREGQASDAGTVFKAGNFNISGLRAVILKEENIVEVSRKNSFFSRTGWLRSNNINYYINVMGNGIFTDKESKYLERMFNSFKLHM